MARTLGRCRRRVAHLLEHLWTVWRHPKGPSRVARTMSPCRAEHRQPLHPPDRRTHTDRTALSTSLRTSEPPCRLSPLRPVDPGPLAPVGDGR